MRLILLYMSVLGIAACSVTAPDYSRTCFAPGDTIGYSPLIQKADSLILSCFFLLETETRCFRTAVKRYTRTDCIEGTKWKG